MAHSEEIHREDWRQHRSTTAGTAVVVASAGPDPTAQGPLLCIIGRDNCEPLLPGAIYEKNVPPSPLRLNQGTSPTRGFAIRTGIAIDSITTNAARITQLTGNLTTANLSIGCHLLPRL
jgi:hypothetical protein